MADKTAIAAQCLSLIERTVVENEINFLRWMRTHDYLWPHDEDHLSRLEGRLAAIVQERRT